ncbi:uncharacterized protein LOC114162455 isoform X1 [Vigna unguiculata]|uniref:uncharacterized protein LOC114162455 isoform X1 n=1 Tax=Vigna unguiculata TaxID=3917 RepID=UPI001016CF41|nr:uncharacterized protein LOC114162455 isoform X1 [Vigna unguiculata]
MSCLSLRRRRRTPNPSQRRLLFLYTDDDEELAVVVPSSSKSSFFLHQLHNRTQNLNVKALGLVNKINWPLYKNISMASSGEVASIPGSLSLVNLKIVNRMAENFLVYLEEHVIWFVECCSDLELSKTLFFFVLLQSFCIKRKE